VEKADSELVSLDVKKKQSGDELAGSLTVSKLLGDYN
jgi:hypothetical protein